MPNERGEPIVGDLFPKPPAPALVYWTGPAPTECATCLNPIQSTFIDGRIPAMGGSWGCMCPECHAVNGVGLGKGRGQQFEKQPDGRWLKTAG